MQEKEKDIQSLKCPLPFWPAEFCLHNIYFCGQVFRLHSQKLKTLARMSHPNHQELVTSHQVKKYLKLQFSFVITEPLLRQIQVLLAVISRQPRDAVRSGLKARGIFCSKLRYKIEQNKPKKYILAPKGLFPHLLNALYIILFNCTKY